MEETVDNAEVRGVRTDPDAERKNRDRGRKRVPPQHADPVTHILPERLAETCSVARRRRAAENFPARAQDPIAGAEFASGGPLCLAFGHAGGHVRSGPHVEMETDFLLHLTIDRRMALPETETTEESSEPVHRRRLTPGP